MPFADPRYPSVALGTLSEALRARSHHVDVHHLHLDAAAALGLSRYYDLQGGTSWYHQIGEWVFHHPELNPGAASPSRFREFLGPYDGQLEIDMAYIRDDKSGATRMLYDVMQLDAVRQEADALLDGWLRRIDFGQYDVVGFTVVFQQLNASLRLARAIKEKHPHVRVVLGGAALEPPMGRAVSEQHPWVDAFFGGFSDVTFPDYVDHLPVGASNSGRYVLHDGPAIKLDDLPVPVYDDYFHALDRTGLRGDLQVRVPLETSRGCWWGAKKHCTFCGFNGNEMWFRQKSAARAKAEIDALAKYDGALYFVDNIIPMDYFRDLFPQLEAEGKRFDGGFLFTKSNIGKEELSQLARLGFTWLQPGIESLSSDILETMKKGVRAVQNVWFLRASEEVGVHPLWGILYGFPRENQRAYEEMAALLPRLSHLPAPTGSFEILMVRYSPIHAKAQEMGLTDVRPSDAYVHAFGDHPGIADQAYAFEYRHADGAEPREYAKDVVELAKRWTHMRALPLAPRCELWTVGGQTWLFDSRDLQRFGRATPRVRRVSERELVVLRALEAPRTRKGLSKLVDGMHEETLARVLDRLIEEGLVLSLDGRLVRLALIREDPSLVNEARRVLADKWKQLRFSGVQSQLRRAAAKGELKAALRGLARKLRGHPSEGASPPPML